MHVRKWLSGCSVMLCGSLVHASLKRELISTPPLTIYIPTLHTYAIYMQLLWILNATHTSLRSWEIFRTTAASEILDNQGRKQVMMKVAQPAILLPPSRFEICFSGLSFYWLRLGWIQQKLPEQTKLFLRKMSNPNTLPVMHTCMGHEWVGWLGPWSSGCPKAAIIMRRRYVLYAGYY